MSISHSTLFKVLGETRRRRILATLKDNEFSVQELQKILSMGQSIISAHLAILKLNNLVCTRRQGKFVLYRLNTDAGAPREVLDAALKIAPKEEWHARDLRQIERILKVKKEASLSFYEGLEYQNKRSPGQTDHSLAIALMRSVRGKRIVDIGCGSGALAREFARRNSVIGLDINAQQVKMAERLSKKEMQQYDLTFKISSAEKIMLEDSSADILLFSHSLHHVEHPYAAIEESYRVLGRGGVLLILDLHEHSDPWLQEMFRDVHCGFSSSTMNSWLKKAQFTHIYIETDLSDMQYPDFETLIITAEKE